MLITSANVWFKAFSDILQSSSVIESIVTAFYEINPFQWLANWSIWPEAEIQFEKCTVGLKSIVLKATMKI